MRLGCLFRKKRKIVGTATTTFCVGSVTFSCSIRTVICSDLRRNLAPSPWKSWAVVYNHALLGMLTFARTRELSVRRRVDLGAYYRKLYPVSNVAAVAKMQRVFSWYQWTYCTPCANFLG